MSDSMIPEPPAAPVLPEGRFVGREDFRQLVRDALACAAREGWTEIVLSDPDFHDWPLGERAVAESLQAWARAGRTCTLLAADFGAVLRQHARFVQWRTRWGHLIHCRKASCTRPIEVPSALWAPGWGLHRLDAERCVGVSGTEPDRRVLLRESLDEWLLRKSGPGFPATTLGL
ncbi:MULTISPECIES: hypothetical protein [unclassified Acidovorax]|uniref:hypothetical protein n=1 Tax=unclassified Acidovorax TaxID=2684926 RepID=UPI002883047D|nr:MULTISPECIES: hypothetical protein [unclassified Acidovorax]